MVTLLGTKYAETRKADVLGRVVSTLARQRVATDRAKGSGGRVAKYACHCGRMKHLIHEMYCDGVIHDVVDLVCSEPAVEQSPVPRQG